MANARGFMGSLRYEIQRCVLHSLLFGVRFLRFGVVFYADLGIIILAEPGGSAVKYLTMSGNLPSFFGAANFLPENSCKTDDV